MFIFILIYSRAWSLSSRAGLWSCHSVWNVFSRILDFFCATSLGITPQLGSVVLTPEINQAHLLFRNNCDFFFLSAMEKVFEVKRETWRLLGHVSSRAARLLLPVLMSLSLSPAGWLHHIKSHYLQVCLSSVSLSLSPFEAGRLSFWKNWFARQGLVWTSGRQRDVPRLLHLDQVVTAALQLKVVY